MKCPHCSSEWAVSHQVRGDVKQCPFCGQKLDSPKNERLDTLEAVLVQIVTDQGIESLYDGHRMIGLFTDLAPNMKRESRILKCFVDAEGHKMLNEARNADLVDQRLSMKQTVRKMTDEFAVAEDAARLVCEAYWFALTGKPMQSQTAKQLPSHSKASNDRRKHTARQVTTKDESKVEQRKTTGSPNAPQTATTSVAMAFSSKLPIIISVVAMICLAILVFTTIIPRREQMKKHDAIYQEAQSLFTAGNYEDLIIYLSNQETDMSEHDDLRLIYDKAYGQYKEEVLSRISARIESEQYAEAIQLIDSLIPQIREDSQIKNTRLNIRDQYKNYALVQADALCVNAEYSAARSILTVAVNVIGEDVAFVQKLKEIEISEVLSAVASFEKESNYAGAVTYLRQKSSIVSTSAELQEKMITCTDKYREDAIADAASVYSAEGYSGAVSILEKALKVIPDDELISAEKERYNALAPVALVDTVCIYNTTKKQTGLTLNDKLGNTYYNATQYRGGADYYGDDAYSRRDIYVLGKEYTRFKARVFVPKDRSAYWDNEISSSDKQRGAFTLCVYGDEKLLYQSPLMISTQYPIDVEIDVSGVEQLSFSWNTFADVSSEIGIADAYLYKD